MSANQQQSSSQTTSTGPEKQETSSDGATPSKLEPLANIPLTLEKDTAAAPKTTGVEGQRQGEIYLTPVEPPVQVSPYLLDLVAGVATTPAEAQAVRQQRDLNELLHRTLVIGLIISTALILVGLGLDAALQHEVPTVVPDFVDVFVRVKALRPSGFLALGLLVLIATPILRVVGSIFIFLYERDWRFTGVTLLVFIVVMVSLFLGKG